MCAKTTPKYTSLQQNSSNIANINYYNQLYCSKLVSLTYTRYQCSFEFQIPRMYLIII